MQPGGACWTGVVDRVSDQLHGDDEIGVCTEHIDEGIRRQTELSIPQDIAEVVDERISSCEWQGQLRVKVLGEANESKYMLKLFWMLECLHQSWVPLTNVSQDILVRSTRTTRPGAAGSSCEPAVMRSTSSGAREGRALVGSYTRKV